MDNDRRTFFKRGLGVVAAVSVAQLAAQRAAFAEDLPPVDPASPQATGLGYVENAANVDKTKYANFQDGQHCAVCIHYQGAEGSERGGCAIFPGQSVAAPGWCSAFAPKA